MAFEVIQSDRTTTYFINLDDVVYVDRDVSVVVSKTLLDSVSGLKTSSTAAANTTVTIDGSVIAVSDFASALLLIGTDSLGVGSHEVLIGATGVARGLIGGGVTFSGTSNTLTNFGAISGGTTGVSLGSGVGLLTNNGTIFGGTTGVTGNGGSNEIYNTGTIQSNVTGVTLSGSNNKIINQGDVLSDATALQLLNASQSRIRSSGHIEAGGIGINVEGTGSLNLAVNSGLINAQSFGISMATATAVARNAGTIVSDSTAIQMTGTGRQTAINSGDIDASNGGINITLSGSVLNAGSIVSGGSGVTVGGADASVMNSGDITAGQFAIRLVTDGQVHNRGNLAAVTGITAAGASLVQNMGEISAIATGIRILDDNALAFNGATVNNVGRISADIGLEVLAADVTITNMGEISGNKAILVKGNSANITNSGTLMGADVGINVFGSNTAIITTGQITSAQVGVAVIDTKNLSGIVGRTSIKIGETGGISSQQTGINVVDTALFVVNHGEIHGGSGFAAISVAGGATVLRNHGLISSSFSPNATGSTTIGNALDLGNAVDRVTNFGALVGTVALGDGNDILRNFGLIDGEVLLGAGNDVLDSSNGEIRERISGDTGNDTIFGNDFNESYDGGSDNDRIGAGGGFDTLVGGLGADSLSGGADSDVFILRSAAESGLGAAADRITDFTVGFDDLDLRLFMAGGSFIGAAAFGGIAKQVRYIAATGVIQGDVDGNGTADWEVVLNNKAAVTAADFLF